MLKSVRCIVALGGLTVFGFAPPVIRAVEPGKPAVTALETTAYRAIGAKHPDPNIRNGDYLAERFLGTEERAILKAEGSETVLAALELETVAAWKSLGPGIAFATAVHVRTRHIDEMFKESLAAGATQVVILGAGLDSRAYRFGEALRGSRVFEVDFPPTQEYKKKRVQEILNGLPPHVAYVPIDFTKDDLGTVLRQAGYDTTKKTVFVWEGVTFYIPETAVNGTLAFVASNSAPGSRIVFDYFLESALKSASIVALNKRLTALGEPLIFGIPDDNRDGFIARQGLRIISEVGTNELRRRFLPLGLVDASAPSANYVCTAEVPERR
jgi:methyltransferase (TIGR00027 family)